MMGSQSIIEGSQGTEYCKKFVQDKDKVSVAAWSGCGLVLRDNGRGRKVEDVYLGLIIC